MDVYYPDATIGIEVIPEPEVTWPEGLPADAVTLYVGEDQLDDVNLMDALFSFICVRAEERARKGARRSGKCADTSAEPATRGAGASSNGYAEADKAAVTGCRLGEKSPLGEKFAERIASRAPGGAFPYASVVGDRPEDGAEPEPGYEGGLEPDADDCKPVWSYEEWLEDYLDSTCRAGAYDLGGQPLLSVGSCQNLYVSV